MPDKDNAYRFRVEGSEPQRTYLPTPVSPFDETFEIEGEHPAEALEKLLREIEWGILDSDEPFTISYLGAICSHQRLIGQEHCNRCQLEGFCDGPECREHA